MANSNEYMAAYMNARYHRRRAEAVELLGGRCVQCGSTDALELDHIDRTTKAGELGRLFSRGEARYRAELAKCQLLCEECHRRKSADEQSVEHGGGKTGKKNCRCRLCGPLKNKYMREWKEARAASSDG